MILKAIKYNRNQDDPNEWWCIEGHGDEFEKWLPLNLINLVVGSNASGKTRMIDAIRQIAELLTGSKKPTEFIYDTASYELRFEDNDKEIYYFLNFKDGKITQEILKENGQEKLNRAEGRLHYAQIKEDLELEISDDLVAVARPDTKQQPFFRSLHEWGKRVTHFQFGGTLGKKIFLRDINRIQVDIDTEIDLRSGDNAIEAFIRGRNHAVFVESIIQDMDRIGYPIDNVDVARLKFVPAYGLNVKEKDLNVMTDQMVMSQGMFRAFSLLVQLNYFLLAQIPSCILIDDIGEGLDYERSKKLIDLIIEKIKNSTIQVIMTTNDRFVMNAVSLAYWNVIQRVKNKSVVYNYINSKQTFDDFAFTALNNFDFFATNFFITGFEEYVNEDG